MNNLENIKFDEKINVIKLANGLNVIIDPIANTQTSSIGFFLKNGSRDENNEERGYSHFCEHMIFKGTINHNQKELSKLFDNMGGYLNAYTTHELVVLYNRIPFFYLKEAITLMNEMYTNSIFHESEMEIERDVILNEIKSELEDPHDRIHETFMQNIFPDQTLGHPIIGTNKSIKNAAKKNLYNFYFDRFNLENLLIVISGKIEDDIPEFLENLKFRKNNFLINNKITVQGNKKFNFTSHSCEQIHVVLGSSKFELDIESYVRIGLLNLILGESMSSKFFQKIREELGLCYTIYTFFNKFREENLFGLYLSVMPKNINKAIDAISDVIRNLLKTGITQEELDQAKNQKMVEIILNSDITQKRIQRLAFMNLTLNKILKINDLIDIIRKTAVEDLNLLIKKVFIKENIFTEVLYKKEIKIKEWDF